MHWRTASSVPGGDIKCNTACWDHPPPSVTMFPLEPPFPSAACATKVTAVYCPTGRRTAHERVVPREHTCYPGGAEIGHPGQGNPGVLSKKYSNYTVNVVELRILLAQKVRFTLSRMVDLGTCQRSRMVLVVPLSRWSAARSDVYSLTFSGTFGRWKRQSQRDSILPVSGRAVLRALD